MDNWKGYALFSVMTFFVMTSYSLVSLVLAFTDSFTLTVPSFSALIMAMLMWCAGAAALLVFAKRKWNFSLLSKSPIPNLKGIIVCALLAVVFTVLLALIWGGFKPCVEFQNHVYLFGGLGRLYFVLQVIYYFIEMLLALLLVIFSQKALEIITSRKKIPWGGFALGLSWGLAHIFTQGDIGTGLFAFALGVFLGLPYLLLNRNIKLAWVFMVLIFI
jgi:hypothetical protein